MQIMIHFKPVVRVINLFMHLFRHWWLGTSLQTKCMPQSYQSSYCCNTITCASKY